VHVFSEAALTLNELLGSAALFDIMSGAGLLIGELIFPANVDATVLLTALTGAINTVDGIEAAVNGQLHLTALDGEIGDAAPLAITQFDGAVNMVAAGGIAAHGTTGLTLGHAVSEQGAVRLSAGTILDVELLGSPDAPELDAQEVTGTARWGRAEDLQTLPVAVSAAQNVGAYRAFAVLGDDADSGTGGTGGTGGTSDTGGTANSVAAASSGDAGETSPPQQGGSDVRPLVSSRPTFVQGATATQGFTPPQRGPQAGGLGVGGIGPVGGAGGGGAGPAPQQGAAPISGGTGTPGGFEFTVSGLPSAQTSAQQSTQPRGPRVGGSQGPRAAGDVQPQDDRGSDPDEDEKEEEEKDEPAGEESEKPQDESERRDARRKAWHRGVRSWLMCGPGALGFMDFLNFTVG
jgi:hypothetical protein